jgi:hypothetical protein
MSENLIVNGTFEGRFQDYEGIPGMAVAAGWTPWWVSQTPDDQAWKNRRPEYKSAPVGVDPRRVQVGESSQMYSTLWGTHVAGLYQQMRVAEGATVRFTCYGHAWSSEGDNPRLSENPGNVRMRVGIDPQGGTDPFSGTVVWSREKAAYDKFEAFAVEALACRPVVTVFTFSAPDWPKKHNEVFWDDASLTLLSGETVHSGPSHSPGVVEAPQAVPQVAEGAVRGAKYGPEAGERPAIFMEAPGRLVNRTVQVQVTGPTPIEGVSLRVYGPYGQVQADWFGAEPGGWGQVWKWSFVPRKAGHYMARFRGTGVGPVDGGIYIFEEVAQPPVAGQERGKPRAQYERIYLLMPPDADRPWLQAVIDSGVLDDRRHTLGFSADDAGIGDLDQRRVLVINPVGWREPLELWFAQHYPGVQVRTLNVPAPSDLEVALKIGLGQEKWD